MMDQKTIDGVRAREQSATPERIEFYKCSEDGDEVIREREVTSNYDGTNTLVAEFPIYNLEGFEKSAWVRAKRAARDFLISTPWAKCVLLCTSRNSSQRTIAVYNKHLNL